jgi:hypothetical protein
MSGRHDLSAGLLRAARNTMAQWRSPTYLHQGRRKDRCYRACRDPQEAPPGVAKKQKPTPLEQMALFLALLKPTVNPPGAT